MSQNGGLFRKYVLDTCFFIDLYAHHGTHPRDRFVGLWDHFQGQVQQGVIIAPMEVKDELRGDLDAELDKWLVDNRSIFVDISPEQVRVLTAIVIKYPHFTNGKQDMADPSVVALACSEGLAVLTSERYRPSPSIKAPKIPNLCQEHGVRCLGISDYMRDEGLVLR